MAKIYTTLGLMSGTSLDGIDASIIQSDGEKIINIKQNRYFKYDKKFHDELSKFIINCDSKKYVQENQKTYNKLEKKLTLAHIKISKKILLDYKSNVDLVGFHGQTIIHKPKKGYSIQMGDANLMSKTLKKKVIYQFRQKDIKNKGEGAPLSSIYHYNLSKKLKLKEPVIFLNIGGISNITYIYKNKFKSEDIGPGNILIDTYIKKNKNKKFDKDGFFASIGKINNNTIKNKKFLKKQKHSYDIKDFHLSFVNKLNFEDGMATLNYYTANIISNFLNRFKQVNDIIICGGGRKNKTLINSIKKLTSKKIINIDDFSIDGDFIESQAFAYLAIRSFLGKKISYPETTKVLKASSGGELVKNF